MQTTFSLAHPHRHTLANYSAHTHTTAAHTHTRKHKTKAILKHILIALYEFFALN